MPYFNGYYWQLPNGTPVMPPVLAQPQQMNQAQHVQQMQQVQQQQNVSNQSEQLINGGFVVVQSEEEIKRYPVQPGNYITFRIEGQPVLVEKSLSRSQFASPKYERYRIVKENEVKEETPAEQEEKPDYALANDLKEIKESVEQMDKRMNKFKEVLIKTKQQLTPKQEIVPVENVIEVDDL